MALKSRKCQEQDSQVSLEAEKVSSSRFCGLAAGEVERMLRAAHGRDPLPTSWFTLDIEEDVDKNKALQDLLADLINAGSGTGNLAVFQLALKLQSENKASAKDSNTAARQLKKMLQLVRYRARYFRNGDRAKSPAWARLVKLWQKKHPQMSPTKETSSEGSMPAKQDSQEAAMSTAAETPPPEFEGEPACSGLLNTKALRAAYAMDSPVSESSSSEYCEIVEQTQPKKMEAAVSHREYWSAALQTLARLDVQSGSEETGVARKGADGFLEVLWADGSTSATEKPNLEYALPKSVLKKPAMAAKQTYKKAAPNWQELEDPTVEAAEMLQSDDSEVESAAQSKKTKTKKSQKTKRSPSLEWDEEETNVNSKVSAQPAPKKKQKIKAAEKLLAAPAELKSSPHTLQSGEVVKLTLASSQSYVQSKQASSFFLLAACNDKQASRGGKSHQEVAKSLWRWLCQQDSLPSKQEVVRKRDELLSS